MTELEIKAEENCKTYLCRECNRIFECDGNVALCSKARTFCKNRLIELLQEENAELKAQNKDLCESLDIMNNRESELLEQIAELKEKYESNKIAISSLIGKSNKEINDLKAQIEKMKCCGNCKNHDISYEYTAIDGGCCVTCNCRGYDCWELAGQNN